MASRTDPLLQTIPDNTQIVVHRLPPGHLQFQKNMIIRTADQNAGLLHADLPDQLKVLPAGTDPACNLRITIAPLHTFIDSIPVLLAVQEEFTGTDHTVWAAQFMQMIVDRDDLFRRVRRPGLLAVPEGRIRDPDILRHIVGHRPVIERNLRNLGIRKHIPENIRFLHIIQNIHVLFYFQKIVVIVHGHRTIRESSFIIHSCHHTFPVAPYPPAYRALYKNTINSCTPRIIVYNHTAHVNHKPTQKHSFIGRVPCRTAPHPASPSPACSRNPPYHVRCISFFA